MTEVGVLLILGAIWIYGRRMVSELRRVNHHLRALRNDEDRRRAQAERELLAPGLPRVEVLQFYGRCVESRWDVCGADLRPGRPATRRSRCIAPRWHGGRHRAEYAAPFGPRARNVPGDGAGQLCAGRSSGQNNDERHASRDSLEPVALRHAAGALLAAALGFACLEAWLAGKKEGVRHEVKST
jgi:hypothetical protein